MNWRDKLFGRKDAPPPRREEWIKLDPRSGCALYVGLHNIGRPLIDEMNILSMEIDSATSHARKVIHALDEEVRLPTKKEIADLRKQVERLNAIQIGIVRRSDAEGIMSKQPHDPEDRRAGGTPGELHGLRISRNELDIITLYGNTYAEISGIFNRFAAQLQRLKDTLPDGETKKGIKIQEALDHISPLYDSILDQATQLANFFESMGIDRSKGEATQL